jgi:PKD repeat protein
VSFNGTGSTNETSYAWDLDTKTATGATPTANYASSPGTHVVGLQVSGPGGTSDPTYQSVTCP